MVQTNIQMKFNNFGKVGTEVRKRLKKQVETSGAVVEVDCKKRITNPPKSGIIYTRKNGVKHQSSAPGESPAGDTGFLADNVVHTNEGLTSFIDVNTDYASALEFGSIDPKNRPAARPFMQPSMNAETPKFIGGCEKAVSEGSSV